MEVSRDKYELPVVISDNISGLARKLGVKENTIRKELIRSKKKNQKSKYIRVEIEDD